MAWYRNLRMVGKIVIPTALMLIVALGLLSWQIQSRSSLAIRAVAERELAALAGEHGNSVLSFFGQSLEQAQGMAEATANALKEKQPISRALYLAMLSGIEKGNEAFIGAGAAFEPNAFDGKDAQMANSPGSDASGRFIPYQVGGMDVAILEDLETSEYYAAPKRRNHSHLSNPNPYTLNGKSLIMTTASAVVRVDNQFRGVVVIDMLLDTIATRVNEVKVYSTGWGSLITQNGLIVAHKDNSLVLKNLFDTRLVADREGLRKAMTNGERYLELHAEGGEQAFYYYYPIHFETTGQTWYFCVSAPLDEVLAEAREISQVTMIISFSVLILALLVIFVVVRSSVRPLGYLSGVAKEIAGGNLHMTIKDESFGGEVKELSTALKDMIASLLENITKAEEMSADAKAQAEKAQLATREAEAMRLAAESAKREGMLAAADRLEDVVHIISSASEQLSAQIEESERGSQEQAGRVGETATAMEEMNVTVLEVARNAGAASDMSAQTKAKAEEGAHIVQDAVKGIQNVQDVSLILKEDMTKLAGQANSISDIMSVISDLADQTNLLALNAAIEAARAGDAGRGFAVVADEVRKLAEKTMTSTINVGKTVSSIQQSVKESITQVDRAVSLIGIATEQSNKSGAALGSIVSMVEGTADQVRNIATASEEQSATSEEINRAINGINNISMQTALTMQEAAKAVSDLASQAQALSRLIEEMKNS